MPRDAACDAADAPRTRRERADDAADAPASPSAPPRAEAEIPEWLERCRAEARPSFDVSAYRWPEIFAALFRTEAWGAANHRAIDAMHELTELRRRRRRSSSSRTRTDTRDVSFRENGG